MIDEVSEPFGGDLLMEHLVGSVVLLQGASQGTTFAIFPVSVALDQVVGFLMGEDSFEIFRFD